MIYEMITCLCCLVLCCITMIVNIIVYWKINRLLKKEGVEKWQN